VQVRDKSVKDELTDATQFQSGLKLGGIYRNAPHRMDMESISYFV